MFEGFLVGVIVVVILQQVGATCEFGGTHKGWLLQAWNRITQHLIVKPRR